MHLEGLNADFVRRTLHFDHGKQNEFNKQIQASPQKLLHQKHCSHHSNLPIELPNVKVSFELYLWLTLWEEESGIFQKTFVIS
jgi:hypothetical protein